MQVPQALSEALLADPEALSAEDFARNPKLESPKPQLQP